MKKDFLYITCGFVIIISLLTWYINEQITNAYQQNQNLLNKINQLEELTRTQQELLGNLSADYTVLDEAVHADSKRRVKINKVRHIIIKTLKELNTQYTRALTPITITEIAVAIVDNSDKYNVPISLILAMIRQESGFYPKAQSHMGAVGLMQLLPSTAEDIKTVIGKQFYNLHNCSHNIQFGSYYIGKLLHKFNYDISKAVMAYNTGPENVYRYLAGAKLFPETINYEKKVIEYMNNYKLQGVD